MTLHSVVGQALEIGTGAGDSEDMAVLYHSAGTTQAGSSRTKKGNRPHLPERPKGCFAQMGSVPFFGAPWTGRPGQKFHGKTTRGKKRRHPVSPGVQDPGDPASNLGGNSRYCDGSSMGHPHYL